MADKKVRKALDSLRGEIQELAEVFAAFRGQVSAQQAAAAAERQRGNASTPGVRSGAIRVSAATTDASSGTGYVSLFGNYQAVSPTGDMEMFQWSMEDRSIEDLLTFSTDEYAQVLAAIGNKQRLGILLTILARPSTANEVVTGLDLGTTGAAYHHLHVLQAAGLVEQRQRGVFSVVPDQLPSLITIFAGLSGTIAVQTSSPAEDGVITGTEVSDEPVTMPVTST